MNTDDHLDCHKCPVPDCNIQVSRRYLMCNGHWRRVPKEIQDRVYNGWREVMRERKFANYKAARLEAIQFFTGSASTALKLPED